MVEPDHPARDRPSHLALRWSILVGVGMAGLLIGWFFGFTTGTQPGSAGGTDAPPAVVAPTVPTPTMGKDSSASTSHSQATTTTELGPLQGRVELLVGVADLGGPIALTVPGPVGDQNLWFIEPGGRIVQRVDAHIRSGGHRHPMMIVGDYVLFTANEGTFLIGLDLNEPARRLAEPGILIPDADPSRAWLVGGDIPEWFAPFDGETGELGNRTGIPIGFGWPFAGLDGGLLFQDVDRSTYGPLAYWPVAAGPEPFGLNTSSGDGVIYSVVQDWAVLVSPGPRVTIIDIRANERIATFSVELEDGSVVGACLSKTAEYLAVVSSDGFVEIIETATGDVRGRLSTIDPPWSVSWATHDQLTVLAPPLEGRTVLNVFNVEAGITTAIARLTSPASWRISTSTHC